MLVEPAAQEAEIVTNNAVAAEPIVVDVEMCSDPSGDWDNKLLEYSLARFEDSAKFQKAIASRFADMQWFYLVARCGDQEAGDTHLVPPRVQRASQATPCHRA